MKLKSLFFSLFLSQVFIGGAAADVGVSNIQNRGTVLCGTNSVSQDLAYKDDNGNWSGFDSVICKALSEALLGKSNRFQMVPINIENTEKYFKAQKIDVMLGEFPLPAESEITSNMLNVDVLYNEKVMLLAHKIDGATSMEAYKDSKVCMTKNAIDTYYVNNFSDKYKLNLKPLFFPNRDRATEGFFLGRCQLLPGSSNELKTIVKTKFNGKDYVSILPEVIGLRPVYIMVNKNNPTLAITVKWIINALRLAEIYDINSNTLPLMMSEKDTSVQNLLGVTPDLWQKFKISPLWVRRFILDEGNFGEIYNRNLGPGTGPDLDELYPERGLATPKPFI